MFYSLADDVVVFLVCPFGPVSRRVVGSTWDDATARR
jgi:hypothetical protein